MRFTKMHGCGNDYLLIDEPVELSPADVRAACDRRTGVGADGVILMTPSDSPHADIEMRIFNSNGEDGGVCGNGARCVAQRAAALGWTTDAARIAVADRVLVAERLDRSAVRIDMGAPALALADIPVLPAELDELGTLGIEHQVAGLPAVFVSMGNPHLVAIVEEDPDSFDLRTLGPRIERHRAFPHGMNLHIARVTAPDSATVRTWERGAGITLACGTGACAVAVAGALSGRLDRFVTVRMPGGNLETEWDQGADTLRLTGPTATVCQGEWTRGPQSPAHNPRLAAP